MMRSLSFIAGVAFLFVLLVAAVKCGPIPSAQAHSWYPDECCHGRDCYSVDVTADEIQITGEGYYIITSGELIPFADPRVKEFPANMLHSAEDGAADHFHRCVNWAGDDPVANPASPEKIAARKRNTTKCLFVPRGGI